MDLGEQQFCISVTNLDHSIAFYSKLDFKTLLHNAKGRYAVVRHNNMILCLYQGHFDGNMFNFRGGDVQAIASMAEERGLVFEDKAHEESDGSWGATIKDPDGNVIYFNTSPQERKRWSSDSNLFQRD